NWIEGTGIDWKLPAHPLQPDRFQAGWAHGILVEDSSKVRIMNNRILSAAENGIEVKNGRDVTVEGNGISCSEVAIGVHRYQEASVYRSFSPLAQENADGSRVTAGGNIIYAAQEDYDVDEGSRLEVR
ncbi:MAG: right-handed parallel beta-helix repeat-containing protein, partial [Dehalococcoidia bacterium]|nr:right-handed parallel beta-helix repeat-containing protein [Dehalococcoidia bacterium]